MEGRTELLGILRKGIQNQPVTQKTLFNIVLKDQDKNYNVMTFL